jgi:hypothetical protein
VSFNEVKRIPVRVFRFYHEGFKNLSPVGRRLWMIILIKLFIMFAVFRLFFFENFLNSNFDSDAERSEYVIDQLTKHGKDD